MCVCDGWCVDCAGRLVNRCLHHFHFFPLQDYEWLLRVTHELLAPLSFFSSSSFSPSPSTASAWIFSSSAAEFSRRIHVAASVALLVPSRLFALVLEQKW